VIEVAVVVAVAPSISGWFLISLLSGFDSTIVWRWLSLTNVLVGWILTAAVVALLFLLVSFGDYLFPDDRVDRQPAQVRNDNAPRKEIFQQNLKDLCDFFYVTGLIVLIKWGFVMIALMVTGLVHVGVAVVLPSTMDTYFWAISAVQHTYAIRTVSDVLFAGLSSADKEDATAPLADLILRYSVITGLCGTILLLLRGIPCLATVITTRVSGPTVQSALNRCLLCAPFAAMWYATFSC
jgi:hypothetical protein